jgi:hypothetical protein
LLGKTKAEQAVLQYEISFPNEKICGELMFGELRLIPASYEPVRVTLTPSKGLDVGNGRNEILETEVYGGDVGIILDGRGRQPFNLSTDVKQRMQNLNIWSTATNEYPPLETA